MEIERYSKIWEYRMMVKFLKKYQLYDLFLKRKNEGMVINFYNGEKNTFIDYVNQRINNVWEFSDFALDFARASSVKKIEPVVISQFWRFFLLGEMVSWKEEEIHLISKEALKKNLRNKIESNGFRKNDELKELFKKYGLTNRYGR